MSLGWDGVRKCLIIMFSDLVSDITPMTLLEGGWCGDFLKLTISKLPT